MRAGARPAETNQEKALKATAKTSLQSNAAFTVAGSLIPAASSFLTLPPFLHLVGEARYGVLLIAWALFSTFDLLDLGMGNATANQVAKLHGQGRDAAAALSTSITLGLAAGTLAGALLLLFGGFAVSAMPGLPAHLRAEAASTLPWLAVAAPVCTVSCALFGALEGLEQFHAIIKLKVTAQILIQLVPLGIAFCWRPDLGAIVGAIVILKLLTGAIAGMLCILLIPSFWPLRLGLSRVRQMLGYGCYLSVAAAASELGSLAQRVILTALAGVQAVSYFYVPANLVARLWIVPHGMIRPLFPRLSALDGPRSRELGGEALLALAAGMTPVVVLALVAIRPFMEAWVGPALAEKGAPVGELLLVGIWVQSMGSIPSVLLDSRGRPDQTARIRVLGMAVVLPAFWLGLKSLGITGAALALDLQALLEGALLFRAARLSRRVVLVVLVSSFLVVATYAGTASLFASEHLRILLGGALAATSAAWAWHIAPRRLRDTLSGILAKRTRAETGA